MKRSMRWLRVAFPAAALAAWLATSFGQQQAPPAAPRPPAEDTEAEAPPPAAPPAEVEESDDVFIPTEELQPDAAVTFPVDI
jgi:hypothetical protein